MLLTAAAAFGKDSNWILFGVRLLAYRAVHGSFFLSSGTWFCLPFWDIFFSCEIFLFYFELTIGLVPF